MSAALLLLVTLTLSQSPEPPRVAVIYAKEGEAHLTPHGSAEARPVELFDWLSEGDEILVESGGRIAIAFVTGSRYRLTGKARAEARVGALERTEGSLEVLPSIPPLPAPPKLHAEDAFSGTRLGGVVLRAVGSPFWIYPRNGAATLPDHTTLRFGTSTPSAAGYRVVLEDEEGTVLLHVVVKESEVSLTPDLLASGRRYFWRVRALDEGVTGDAAEGEFSTLSAAEASQRNALREGLASASDPYVVALLAEADRSLGLLWEAQEGYCRARDLAPSDLGLSKRCESLESLLRN